jgi:hypothetical protein
MAVPGLVPFALQGHNGKEMRKRIVTVYLKLVPK